MNKNFDKREVVGELIFNSKYARTINGKKETWDEAVGRVMKMHWDFVKKSIDKDSFDKFKPLYSKVFDAYLDKKILGAQRALQFGGDQIIQKHTRQYNCAGSYADRPRFFQELMFVLLCGAGAGYSAQKRHINKLPIVKGSNTKETVTYVIDDSIEGWSDAVGELVNSFFNKTPEVIFDYSQIRPAGALISGGFKAPGYKPLQNAINRIKTVLQGSIGRKMKPFEVHRINCLIADAVISGGVRRASLLCLFDSDDTEMLECKTGDWWHKYPELSRSNNSVVILPTTSKDVYDKVFNSVKEFGEPGFAFLKNPDYLYNPLIIAA